MGREFDKTDAPSGRIYKQSANPAISILERNTPPVSLIQPTWGGAFTGRNIKPIHSLMKRTPFLFLFLFAGKIFNNPLAPGHS